MLTVYKMTLQVFLANVVSISTSAEQDRLRWENKRESSDIAPYDDAQDYQTPTNV